jgi:hypothetical protein
MYNIVDYQLFLQPPFIHHREPNIVLSTTTSVWSVVGFQTFLPEPATFFTFSQTLNYYEVPQYRIKDFSILGKKLTNGYLFNRKPPQHSSKLKKSCTPIIKYLRAGRSGDRFPVGARFFAHVQTGPGAHPASCTMGTGFIPGVKRPGRDADHPPPSSAEFEHEQNYTSNPHLGPLWPVIR